MNKNEISLRLFLLTPHERERLRDGERERKKKAFILNYLLNLLSLSIHKKWTVTGRSMLSRRLYFFLIPRLG